MGVESLKAKQWQTRQPRCVQLVQGQHPFLADRPSMVVHANVRAAVVELYKHGFVAEEGRTSIASIVLLVSYYLT